jgi:copper chaperone
MKQAQIIPAWKDKIVYSENGPHHQILLEDDTYRAVLVGIEAGQSISPHPGLSAVYHILEGTGWVIIDGDRTPVGPGAMVVVSQGSLRGFEAETRLAFLGSHPARKTIAPKPPLNIRLMLIIGPLLMLALMVGFMVMFMMMAPAGIQNMGLAMGGLIVLPVIAMLVIMGIMAFFFRRMMGGRGSPMDMMAAHNKAHPAQAQENPVDTQTYHIPGVSCAHCKMTIERKIGKIPGVGSVNVDVNTRQAVIGFGPPTTRAEIETALAEIGYPSS